MVTMPWSVWLWTLASVAGISLISFIGAVTFVVDRRRAQPVVFVLVGLAVGAMLGDTFLHLLPEAFEKTTSPVATSMYCLFGILVFFVLEKFLLWRHDHADEHTHPVLPVGYINLIADGLHNFIDGVLVGASFLVSVPIGLATTIAVCLHEIPQEIGDFGVLLHAGFSRAKALWLNFLTAILAIAGAVTALLLGTAMEGFSAAVLPLTAGGFIYIAGCDLVPELHKERQPKQAAIQFLAIGAGIGAMLILKLLE
jgi:zinc and cadmium transporter